MPKLNNIDLAKIVDFLMHRKDVARCWIKQHQGKLTYSIVELRRDLPRFLKLMFASNTAMVFGEYLHSFRPYTKEQQKAFELAAKSISEVANVEFKKVPDRYYRNKSGNIRVFNVVQHYQTLLNQVNGFTTYDKKSDKKIIGYTTVNPEVYKNDLKKGHYKPGDAIVDTKRHELAHILGLGHTHKQPAINSSEYSCMSYNRGEQQKPSTLKMYDIAALQAYYGQNKKTRSGNTFYRWSSVEAYSQNMCLWDGGGNDTIDLSNIGRAVLDIRDGEFSTFDALVKNNFSIAFTVNIENVICQRAGSVVFLNALDNAVTAVGGGNTLYLNDTNVHTEINHKNEQQRIKQRLQRYKIANNKKYTGWGNDAYYCKKTANSRPDRFIIDVSDPSKLNFKRRGSHLTVTHKTKALHSNEEFTSSFTILNYKFNPEKYLFLVRTKSSEQTREVKDKFAQYNRSAYQNIQRGMYMDSWRNPMHKVNSRSQISEKIRNFDKKVAYFSKTKIAKTDKFVPLAIGM